MLLFVRFLQERNEFLKYLILVDDLIHHRVIFKKRFDFFQRLREDCVLCIYLNFQVFGVQELIQEYIP